MQPIGILGGTFDPIHKGHLAIAKQALQLGLQFVFFVPVNIPPHRQKPIASAFHRKKMVELATSDEDSFYVDCRELNRNEKSYSIETIKSFRTQFPDTPLFMIIGIDAFNQIDKWHKWDSLLNYVHITVADRPGIKQKVNTLLDEWTQKHLVDNVETLKQKICGNIYFMPTKLTDISSSDIRLAIKKAERLNNFLHRSTINYINEQHLYQDDND